MRYLALPIALLLVVPLLADENPTLERAIEGFRSRSPDHRVASSKLASDECRRLLAPLIRAMEDKDPEVRRRARETILALVPRKAEDPVVAKRKETQQFFNVQNWQAMQKKAMEVQIQLWKRQQKDLQKKLRANQNRARLANLLVRRIGFRGVAAYGVRIPGKREVGAGFMVQSVQRRTTAHRLGLAAGDIVLRVNGIPVVSADHFQIALGNRPDWRRVSFDVLRAGKPVTLALPR